MSVLVMAIASEHRMEIVTIINTQRDKKQLNRHYLELNGGAGGGRCAGVSLLCNSQ